MQCTVAHSTGRQAGRRHEPWTPRTGLARQMEEKASLETPRRFARVIQVGNTSRFKNHRWQRGGAPRQDRRDLQGEGLGHHQVPIWNARRPGCHFVAGGQQHVLPLQLLWHRFLRNHFEEVVFERREKLGREESLPAATERPAVVNQPHTRSPVEQDVAIGTIVIRDQLVEDPRNFQPRPLAKLVSGPPTVELRELSRIRNGDRAEGKIRRLAEWPRNVTRHLPARDLHEPGFGTRQAGILRNPGTHGLDTATVLVRKLDEHPLEWTLPCERRFEHHIRAGLHHPDRPCQRARLERHA